MKRIIPGLFLVFSLQHCAGSVQVSPTVTTQYSLPGLAANGCKNTALFTFTVITCTGGISNSDGDEVLLFPNPVHQGLKIESSLPVKVSIINALGQTVRLFSTQSKNTIVDLSDEPAGCYMVSICYTEGIIYRKIVKE
jgi:hypothetical protein